ncbi:MAG: hypothetical protein ACOC5S_03695 [Acidobacteriota bacterium]
MTTFIKNNLLTKIIAAASLILFMVMNLTNCSSEKESSSILLAELDTTRSFLILSTEKASRDYQKAIKQSLKLHPEAESFTFDPNDLSTAESILKQKAPYYVQVFILPEELEVNFGWDWLIMTSLLDKDPFVDTRTGFITGASPHAAADLVKRTARAVSGELNLPAKMIDNLGPNMQAKKNSFHIFSHSNFVPVLSSVMKCENLSHGTNGFPQKHLSSLTGAGLVHFGGHGHPGQIDTGMTAQQVADIDFSPCICFNGACYTGVVGKYYEMFGPKRIIEEKTVKAQNSFCLNMLQNNTIAYLASLHPDHGMPVYQEMEYMALMGASLGEVIKYTYDSVVLGNGGQIPEFETLSHGMPSPGWTPKEIMLKGTASRVLFGDPSLKIMKPLSVEKPLKMTVENQQEKLIIGAIMNNPQYKAIFTDTFHDYLAFQKNMFNDKVLFFILLPSGFENPSSVKVLGAAHGPTTIKYKLQGWGVEQDRESIFLHAQVDLASQGFMQSEWRNKGAAVGIEVQK